MLTILSENSSERSGRYIKGPVRKKSGLESEILRRT